MQLDKGDSFFMWKFISASRDDTSKTFKSWAIWLLTLSIPLIYYAAFWLRFDGALPGMYWQKYVETVGWLMLVKVIVFSAIGTFRGWSQFVTFTDFIHIIQATTVASMVFAIAEYLFFKSVEVPRGVFMLDWTGTLLVVGVLRAWQRFREELPSLIPWWFRSDDPVLIIGANHAGEALLRNLRRTNVNLHVAGFVSLDPSSVGRKIGGVPVLGTIDQVHQIAASRGISNVLVTNGEIHGRQLRELITQSQKRALNVKVLPSIEQLLSGAIDLRPRQVSIEDLLRREPIELDQQGLNGWLNNRVLLVTGSAGSIGSEIVRQLLRFSPKCLVLIDRWENGQFALENELHRIGHACDLRVMIADVLDEKRISQIFHDFRPEIVFHAAAYKHVPLMEANPGEAVKNIVLAAKVLADVSLKYRVHSFVMISTDKAVNPRSVMGACKRVAELYCQSRSENGACKFVTVRFGNVLDSAGSVVPIFREQIARGGPVTVTHPEMRRYFMTIPEASQLVIQAGFMGKGGEIFVLNMGDPVRIIDLAEDMIRLSGLEPGRDLDIEFSGVRPGEKMFEELYSDDERHITTTHPNIMVARCRQQAHTEVDRAIRRLSNLTEASTDFIAQELARVVPEFARDTLLPKQLDRAA
jgi:FlaA1/EpsC-like NDP-sugar epimerase